MATGKIFIKWGAVSCMSPSFCLRLIKLSTYTFWHTQKPRWHSLTKIKYCPNNNIQMALNHSEGGKTFNE